MKQWNHAKRFGIFGFISGVITTFLFNYNTIMGEPSFTFHLFTVGSPGYVFGLCICLYAWWANIQRNILKLGVFIFCSFWSFQAAYFISIVFLFLGGPLWGGIVGAFLLLIAYQYLIRPLNIGAYLLLTCISGILGTSLFLGFDPGATFEGPSQTSMQIWSLFIIWQTGMALCLGWIIDSEVLTQKKKRSSSR